METLDELLISILEQKEVASKFFSLPTNIQEKIIENLINQITTETKKYDELKNKPKQVETTKTTKKFCRKNAHEFTPWEEKVEEKYVTVTKEMKKMIIQNGGYCNLEPGQKLKIGSFIIYKRQCSLCGKIESTYDKPLEIEIIETEKKLTLLKSRKNNS